MISPDYDPPAGSPPHEGGTNHCEHKNTATKEGVARRHLGMHWEWEDTRMDTEWILIDDGEFRRLYGNTTISNGLVPCG